MNGRGAPASALGWLAVLGSVIAGVCVFTILPMLVGALDEAGRLSGMQIGWIAAADTAGMMLVAVSGPLWVQRIAWRSYASFGLLVMCVANLLSPWVMESFAGLFAMRVAAGLGTGLAYCIALASLGAHANSERAFGFAVAAQVIYGVVSLGLMPTLLDRFGVASIFNYMTLWTLAALAVCLFAFPHRGGRAVETGLAFVRNLWRPAAIVFSGMALYYVAMGGVWAYIERVGDGAQLQTADIGRILMVGYALSFFGAIACEKVSLRIGRSRTLLLAGTIQCLTLLLLLLMDVMPALIIYAAATILYQFFWSFALPAAMAIFNGVDSTGRVVVLSVSAFKAGEFAGPPLIASSILAFGLDAVTILGVVFITAGLSVLLMAQRRYCRERPA